MTTGKSLVSRRELFPSLILTQLTNTSCARENVPAKKACRSQSEHSSPKHTEQKHYDGVRNGSAQCAHVLCFYYQWENQMPPSTYAEEEPSQVARGLSLLIYYNEINKGKFTILLSVLHVSSLISFINNSVFPAFPNS